MDAGSKFAVIGCLAQPFPGLFPDIGSGAVGDGAVAALVEQHIGLVGLKLIF